MRFWFLNLILQEKELELLGKVADSGLHACMLSHFSCVQLCVTLWVVAHQASLSMGFVRQEDWSGLLCPPPGESSQPRHPISISYVFCIGRRILYHSPHLGSPFRPGEGKIRDELEIFCDATK